MSCSYCGVGGHDLDTCPERLEDKFGTEPVSLRDEETRDDENTHARRNAAQLAMAENTEDENHE